MVFLAEDSSKLLALKKWTQQNGTVGEDTYHASLVTQVLALKPI